MEAIHPKASKGMELNSINLRVKNAFEPAHEGTLITKDFISKTPRVSILCGRDDLTAVEVSDPEMVGERVMITALCLTCKTRHQLHC